jgi:hypothetical protein
MSGSGAAYSASIAAWPSAQVVAARNRGRTVLRSTQRFAWRMLPRDFPPVTTAQRYLYAWRDSGLSSTINHLLLMVRLASGRVILLEITRNRVVAASDVDHHPGGAPGLSRAHRPRLGRGGPPSSLIRP